ncbi:GntR family transcriptional regulator [Martelella soudanensis]|uniref:GntR family transcriptional regulator n=1 Tax=unclassified Martelella TaxID=2629616 RepID=UPI0015DDF2B9|nr:MULTISPECIES: GntR family transcriptional regulator [unclassified Martelella]
MHQSASSQKLFEQIGLSILSGELEPGAKLTEAAMARDLGVNRAPLREALLRLEERDLIERVPYSGMRVAVLGVPELVELYEIRGVLEGLAARRAAERITDEEIAVLRSYVDEGEIRVREFGSNDARLLPAIRDIHTEIARISNNAGLQKLLGREIWQFLRVAHTRFGRSPERLAVASKEHAGVVEALAQRDGELAELLMLRHIGNACKELLQETSGNKG